MQFKKLLSEFGHSSQSSLCLILFILPMCFGFINVSAQCSNAVDIKYAKGLDCRMAEKKAKDSLTDPSCPDEDCKRSGPSTTVVTCTQIRFKNYTGTAV